MKKLVTCFFALALLTIFDGCSKQSLQNVVNETIDHGISNEEVTIGLKDALVIGINKGFDQAARTNGFYSNSKIRISFPEDARKVETTLRRIGLGKEVDKFVIQLNRGAEKAALQAKPIFLKAINDMTIDDAWAILRGNDDAATQYLRKTSSTQLYQQFNPIIKRSLDQVNATKYYGDIIRRYNRIPSVQKVNPDLDDYATKKAMDGLFTLIAEEEANIRENPTARTTGVMRRVFAHQ